MIHRLRAAAAAILMLGCGACVGGSSPAYVPSSEAKVTIPPSEVASIKSQVRQKLPGAQKLEFGEMITTASSTASSFCGFVTYVQGGQPVSATFTGLHQDGKQFFVGRVLPGEGPAALCRSMAY